MKGSQEDYHVSAVMALWGIGRNLWGWMQPGVRVGSPMVSNNWMRYFGAGGVRIFGVVDPVGEIRKEYRVRCIVWLSEGSESGIMQ